MLYTLPLSMFMTWCKQTQKLIEIAMYSNESQQPKEEWKVKGYPWMVVRVRPQVAFLRCLDGGSAMSVSHGRERRGDWIWSVCLRWLWVASCDVAGRERHRRLSESVAMVSLLLSELFLGLWYGWAIVKGRWWCSWGCVVLCFWNSFLIYFLFLFSFCFLICSWLYYCALL